MQTPTHNKHTSEGKECIQVLESFTFTLLRAEQGHQGHRRVSKTKPRRKTTRTQEPKTCEIVGERRTIKPRSWELAMSDVSIRVLTHRKLGTARGTHIIRLTAQTVGAYPHDMRLTVA